MSAHFPPEIDDEIVSYLWDENDSLKACSLACRAFLPACQKHLLSKIVLFPPTDRKKRGNGARFQQLLKNSPHISKYIHYLEVIDRSTQEKEWLSKDTTLTYSLPLLRCLKALVIQYRTSVKGGNWERIARGGLLGSLLDVMRLPSLTYLNFRCLPVAMVNYCPSLKHLALNRMMNLAVAPAMLPIDSSKTIYLDSLKVHLVDLCPISTPVTILSQVGWLADMINKTQIDVGRLKKLHVEAGNDIRAHVEMKMLLSHCGDSLEELAFVPAFSSTLPGVEDPIDWSVLTKLRTFYIQIEMVCDNDEGVFYDPFPWFINMITQVSSSPIEEFVVEVNYRISPLDAVDMSSWTDVMSIFSDQKRFLRLRRLKIRIPHDISSQEIEIVRPLENLTAKLIATREGIDCEVSLVDGYEDFFIFPPDPTWM
ncbi:hypothetical protein BDZ97DRAFT_1754506 [Flammula alnicola]|nr:hypothetical protein BDZ97DRAFT_1754506 [Flammula alnicola]